MNIQRFQVCSEAMKPGLIIIYTLMTDQNPRRPDKEWRGKVLCYDRLSRMARVESLEEGYERCEDDVWLVQIIRIEPASS